MESLEDKHYTILVEMTFDENNIAEALQLLEEMEDQVIENEDECLIYDITYSEEEPTRIFIYEVYENEKAFRMHGKTAYFKELVADKIFPMATSSRIVKLRELGC